MSKQLHLITPTIPYPPNFGGVIDVFYRIVALRKMGVHIYLHCFKYDRDEAEKLENYCEKVFYYDRKLSFLSLFSLTPFIVKTRSNSLLIQRLNENPFPILYDGLHGTYSLIHSDLKQNKFLRPHNVETDYFRQIAKSESNFFRRLFFYAEHLKLKRYEKKMGLAKVILPISINDQKYFSKYSESHLIRAFHSNSSVTSQPGKGTYALYHGNMTISENIKAIQFLMKKVIPYINTPVIFAGKINSKSLVKSIGKYSNVELVENPSHNKMNALIQNAHIVLLPTFQNTGIKLKLLESLFKGRLCVANKAMLQNTELEEFCLEANSPKDWIHVIKEHMGKSFSAAEINKRQRILSIFDNEKEAKKIVNIIFNN